MKKYYFLLFIVITIVSCNNGIVYEQYMSVPDTKLSTADTISFIVNVEDTISVNKVDLVVRNNSNYSYRNLYLFIKVESPNGNELIDSIDIALAQENGDRLGTGWGDVMNVSVNLLNSVTFPNKGEYKFSFVHGMRDIQIEGICDLGMRVEEREK